MCAAADLGWRHDEPVGALSSSNRSLRGALVTATEAGPSNCTVTGLRGQTIVFTGKVHLRGEHVKRPELMQLARTFGARTKNDFSNKINLVVWGDLSGQTVKDSDREFSRKLLHTEQTQGSPRRHVHVVDAPGFESLMAGHAAPCRNV